MSLENVEIAWRAVEAFNRTFAAGTEDFFELLDDDVEWVPITALLDGTAYRGRDAVRKWIDDLRPGLGDRVGGAPLRRRRPYAK
jgi:hypothetical protein